MKQPELSQRKPRTNLNQGRRRDPRPDQLPTDPGVSSFIKTIDLAQHFEISAAFRHNRDWDATFDTALGGMNPKRTKTLLFGVATFLLEFVGIPPISVPPLCTLCLLVGFLKQTASTEDTERTQDVQRRPS
jgi:hypothetical protein